ncbi:MAG: PGF-pre-PGF domain-containing protein, partial [Candidatus Diapherotrites archaeon]
SGSGGGGGTGNRGTTQTTIEKEIPNIEAGTNQLTNYSNTEQVMYVRLYAENTITNTKLTLTENIDAETEGITEPNNTYQIFELTLDNDTGLEKAKIKFAVTEEWLTNNNFEYTNIVLQRLVDGTWINLKTTYINNTDGYYYFTAITPGFSYFAITTQTEAETPTATPEEQEEDKQTPTPKPKTPTQPSTANGNVLNIDLGNEQSMDLITPIIILILIAVIAGTAITFLGKKPEKKNKLGYQ